MLLKNIENFPYIILGKFFVVFARTKLKSKCISIYGVKLWNNLSSDISGIKPFQKFKSVLKRYIIESYKE